MKNKIKNLIKRLLFGPPYEGKLKVGDKIYHEILQRFIRITRITSNKVWYFEVEYPNYTMLKEGLGEEVRGRQLLSEMERRQDVDK